MECKSRQGLAHMLATMMRVMTMAMMMVMTPLVMGILFYGAVPPVALLMRVFGKDPLRRKFEPEAKTYWINREPPGPDPESMRDQF